MIHLILKTRMLLSILLIGGLAISGLLMPKASEAACSGGSCPLIGGSFRFVSEGAQLPKTGSTKTGTFNNGGPGTVVWSANGPVVPRATSLGGDPSILVGSTAPRSIMLPHQALTQGDLGADPAMAKQVFYPLVPQVFIGLFANAMEFPDGAVTFAANGAIPSSLPDTLTVCPGVTVPLTNNPSCDSPAFISSTVTTTSGTIPAVPTAWNGRMRYVKTGARFGANAGNSMAVNNVTGWINYANVPQSVLAGTELVPALKRPGPLAVPYGPGGRATDTNPFNYVFHTGLPLEFVLADVTTSGDIIFPTFPTSLGNTAPGSDVSRLDGPWTTGRISISTSLNAGNNPDLWILSGVDARTENGSGLISMVSGTLTARVGTTTRSAIPGVLSLKLPEPAMSMGLLAGVGLLAGAGRRRKKG